MRQFQFEIRDLFGCSDKPLSCDVEIRYADQMTVMPIEVQVCGNTLFFFEKTSVARMAHGCKFLDYSSH